MKKFTFYFTAFIVLVFIVNFTAFVTVANAGCPAKISLDEDKNIFTICIDENLDTAKYSGIMTVRLLKGNVTLKEHIFLNSLNKGCQSHKPARARIAGAIDMFRKGGDNASTDKYKDSFKGYDKITIDCEKSK